MPLYRCVRRRCTDLTNTERSFQITIGENRFEATIYRGTLPDSDVPVFFIDQPDFFDRDDPQVGAGLYQFEEQGQPRDYPDNCSRFIFFSRGVVEAIRTLDYWPDVLHVNDWQTALAPVYLREIYQRHPDAILRRRFARVRSLLTIHNIGYQGIFWKLDMPLTGLSWRVFTPDGIEFYDHINFLKGGIVYADAINTVSPTYAREIQTPYFGSGLQGVLAHRMDRVYGIVNGVDYGTWNPSTDKFIAAQYAPESIDTGKRLCKRDLQRTVGLKESPHTPVLGLISRLADQKGLDLLEAIVPLLLVQDLQLVVLGTGAKRYHDMLLGLQRQFPGKVSVTLAVDERLAHKIEAGADMFLMPSRYEPCGLNQLYSLKYGTLPIVRATGGLADTVVDATHVSIDAGKATGFTFSASAAAAFLDAIHRALHLFRTEPSTWRTLQQRGMRQDWSWHRSAADYENLYHRIL